MGWSGDVEAHQRAKCCAGGSVEYGPSHSRRHRKRTAEIMTLNIELEPIRATDDRCDQQKVDAKEIRRNERARNEVEDGAWKQ